MNHEYCFSLTFNYSLISPLVNLPVKCGIRARRSYPSTTTNATVLANETCLSQKNRWVRVLRRKLCKRPHGRGGHRLHVVALRFIPRGILGDEYLCKSFWPGRTLEWSVWVGDFVSGDYRSWLLSFVLGWARLGLSYIPTLVNQQRVNWIGFDSSGRRDLFSFQFSEENGGSWVLVFTSEGNGEPSSCSLIYTFCGVVIELEWSMLTCIPGAT